MIYATYADVIRPSVKRQALLSDIILVLGGSILVALCAQLAVKVPFSPVPMTGQTFGVLMVGALLGSRRGILSLGVYLVEGTTGLPVFAGGGFGLAQLLGPTGGYLTGFVAAAFITGWLAERGWDRHFWSAWLAMLIGIVFIYASGLLWLSFYVGWKNVLTMGFYPFLPGAFLKITLAAFLLPAGWKLIGTNPKVKSSRPPEM